MRAITLVFGLVLLLVALSGCERDNEGNKTVADVAEIEKHHERGPLEVVVRVSPEEPTIADQIDLQLEVTVDEDFTVEMPRFGDKLDQFGIRDFTESQPKLVDGNRMRFFRNYELEPFLSGEYTIPPMQFRFAKRAANGEAGTDNHVLETEEVKLTIRSLLDEKKESLKIHEIASPVSLEKPSQKGLAKMIVIGLVALSGIAGTLVWMLMRRKKRVNVPPPVPAHEIAFRQLEQLISDDLPRKGEVKVFYQRISDILRRYIENRFGLHAPEQTTEEFLDSLRQSPMLPPVYQPPLKEFLVHCDMVKFADHEPSTEDIQRTFDSCKHFIIETQSDVQLTSEGGKEGVLQKSAPSQP